MLPKLTTHRLVAGAAALLVLGGTVGLAGSAAQAESVDEDLIGYSLGARADAFGLQFADSAAPVFPGGEVLFASPATAQAALSKGLSTAFASSPTPGSNTESLPAVGNGLLGLFGVPGIFPSFYPFTVTSNHPETPSAEQTIGQSRIAASSSELRSHAEADSGVYIDGPSILRSQATSVTEFDPATDALESRADAHLTGIGIGPNLSIGEIVSHVRLKRPKGGEIQKETSFAVGRVVFAGIPFTFGPKGIEAGPGGTLPGTDPKAAADALEQAGIKFEYVPSEETPNSIRSAGLIVSYPATIPGHGDARVGLVFGRVSAALDVASVAAAPVAAPSEAIPAPADSPSPNGTGSPSSAPSAPAFLEPSLPPPASAAINTSPFPADEPRFFTGASSLTAGVASSAASGTASSAPTPASPPSSPPASEPAPAGDKVALVQPVSAPRTVTGTDGFYAVMLAAGALILIGSGAVSRLATARAAMGPSRLNLPGQAGE